jgi:hypothetical protein
MSEHGRFSVPGFPLLVRTIAFACVFWLVALSLGRCLVFVFRLHSAEYT